MRLIQLHCVMASCVDVQPATPITNPNDECSTAAMRVMQIWLSDDADALRQELVDRNDLPLYLREDQLKPWRLVYAPMSTNREDAEVMAMALCRYWRSSRWPMFCLRARHPRKLSPAASPSLQVLELASISRAA